jgi:PAS domain S-box-containing protein
VESYQEELIKIKTILKKNTKGMTVTDIAREININRNSVAKYLDILLISGQAEMVTFGPAKVFFPSSRLPLSALLNLTSDYIVLLDKELRFIQMSDNFLRFLNVQRSDIIGRSIDTFSGSVFQFPELAQNARRALEGKELISEKHYKLTDQEYYLRIRHIPTTLDDGEPGVTLTFEDITMRKQTEQNMNRIIKEWETTFNSISDMVCIQDNEFSILQVNRSFADFLHKKPEECIGKKCYELLHGTNQPYPSCPCVQAHQTKKPATVELFEPHLRKYLEISSVPIFTDEGDILSSVHILRDKTTQKQQ